ncbi:hypothetical protein BLNAU_19624 [Blattamonas nauphoetae]|uniref:Uncharacterized protein n=1 Tax=Blattamonas nauphoetae TaxID=2049346 RepID=A0ABQ9X0Y6_9EUKA|nr:hypothetical protein BLNAU_19624 [Blattamonas nauphoetae]
MNTRSSSQERRPYHREKPKKNEPPPITIGPPRGTFTDEELVEKSKRLSEHYTVATREAIKANTSRIIASKLKVLGTQSATETPEDDSKLWKRSSQINAQLKELQQEKEGGGIYSTGQSQAKRQEKLWKLTLPIRPESDTNLSLNDQIVDQARTEFAVHYLESSHLPPTHENIELVKSRIKIGKENVQLRTLSRGYLENSLYIEPSGIRDHAAVLKQQSQEQVKHILHSYATTPIPSHEVSPFSSPSALSPKASFKATPFASKADTPKGTPTHTSRRHEDLVQKSVERMQRRAEQKRHGLSNVEQQLRSDPGHVKRTRTGMVLPNEWLHGVSDISSHLYSNTIAKMDDHWEYNDHVKFQQGLPRAITKTEKKRSQSVTQRFKRKVKVESQPHFIGELGLAVNEEAKLARENKIRLELQRQEAEQVMQDRIKKMKEEKEEKRKGTLTRTRAQIRMEKSLQQSTAHLGPKQAFMTDDQILTAMLERDKSAGTPSSTIPTIASRPSTTPRQRQARSSTAFSTMRVVTMQSPTSVGEEYFGHLLDLDLIISPELINRVWEEFGHPGEDLTDTQQSAPPSSNHTSHPTQTPLHAPTATLSPDSSPNLSRFAEMSDTLQTAQSSFTNTLHSPPTSSSVSKLNPAVDRALRQRTQVDLKMLLAASKSPNTYIRFKILAESDDPNAEPYNPIADFSWDWIEQHFVFPFNLKDDRELNAEYLAFIKRRLRSKPRVLTARKKEKKVKVEEPEPDLTSEEFWLTQLQALHDQIEQEQREINKEIGEPEPPRTPSEHSETSTHSSATTDDMDEQSLDSLRGLIPEQGLIELLTQGHPKPPQEEEKVSLEELRMIVPDPTPDELSIYLKAFVAEFPFERFRHRVNRSLITTAIRILHHPLLNRTLRMTIRLAYLLFVQPFFFPTVDPADPHRSIRVTSGLHTERETNAICLDPRFAFCFLTNDKKGEFMEEMSDPFKLLMKDTPHSVHVVAHLPNMEDDESQEQPIESTPKTLHDAITQNRASQATLTRTPRYKHGDEDENDSSPDVGKNPLSPAHLTPNQRAAKFRNLQPIEIDITRDEQNTPHTPVRSPFYPPLHPTTALSLTSPASIRSVRSLRTFPPTALQTSLQTLPSYKMSFRSFKDKPPVPRVVYHSSPFALLSEILPPFSVSLIDQTFLSLSHAYAPLFQEISAFQDAGFTLFLPLTILALQTITRAVIERTYGTGIAVRKSELDGSLEWKFVLKQISNFFVSMFDPSKSAQRFSALESSVQAIHAAALELPRQSQSRMSRPDEDGSSKHSSQSALFFSVSPFIETFVSSSMSAGTRKILSQAGVKSVHESKTGKRQQDEHKSLKPKWSTASISDILCDESKNSLFLLSCAVRRSRAAPPTDGRFRNVNDSVVERKKKLPVVAKRGETVKQEKELEYNMTVLKKKSDTLIGRLDSIWETLRDNTLDDQTCLTEDNLASVLFMQETHPISTRVDGIGSIRDSARTVSTAATLRTNSVKQAKTRSVDNPVRSSASVMERRLKDARTTVTKQASQQKEMEKENNSAIEGWMESMRRTKKDELMRWSLNDDYHRTSVGTPFLPNPPITQHSRNIPALERTSLSSLGRSTLRTSTGTVRRSTPLGHIAQPHRPKIRPSSANLTQSQNTSFHFAFDKLQGLPVAMSDEQIRKMEEEEEMLRLGLVPPPQSLIAASLGEMDPLKLAH